MMSSKEKGDWAEKKAEHFYLKRGYRVLAEKYRYKHGEIDLIVAKGDLVRFIEVKARTGFTYGLPSQYVNYYKREHLRRTAKAFIFKNAEEMSNSNFVFDIAEISLYNRKIRILKNAFEIKEQ